MTYDKRTFGARLKEVRAEQHYTQEKFAEATGLTANFIAHLERGSRGLSLDVLIGICNVLNTTPDNLLGYNL